MAGRSAVGIELTEDERAELSARLRRRTVARADAMRAEIVLLAAKGMSNLAIAERLGITRVTVALWRKRFAVKRLDGLTDEPRPGAPRKIGDDKIAEVVTTTLEKLPATATHWSTRSMARARRADPAGCTPVRPRVGGRDLRLHRSAQRQIQALPLGQLRRRHPRRRRALLPPHHRGPESVCIGTSESGH
jgi:transposase